MNVADSFIDTDMIFNPAGAAWRGERNLYRVHGWDAGPYGVTGKPEMKDDAPWQALWRNDTGSTFDDSVMLRPEMWSSR